MHWVWRGHLTTVFCKVSARRYHLLGVQTTRTSLMQSFHIIHQLCWSQTSASQIRLFFVCNSYKNGSTYYGNFNLLWTPQTQTDFSQMLNTLSLHYYYLFQNIFRRFSVSVFVPLSLTQVTASRAKRGIHITGRFDRKYGKQSLGFTDVHVQLIPREARARKASADSYHPHNIFIFQ